MKCFSFAFVLLQLLIPTFFLSCEKRRPIVLMDMIDSLTYTHPAEALAKLDSLASYYDAMDRPSQVQYLLLRTKAKFKDYQPIDHDSTIEEVTDYYDRKGTNYQRMNAHYLLGNYYAQRGDAPRAMDNFNKAIGHADTIKDIRALMLIHGMICNLYEDLYLDDKAFQEMKRAVYYALKCGDTLSALIYEEGAPLYYRRKNKYDSVEVSANRLYRKWQQIPRGRSNTLVLSYCVDVALVQGDWAKAQSYMDIYERSFGHKDVNTSGLIYNLYDYKARYYTGIGQNDSALYYIGKQQRANGSFGNRVRFSRNYMTLYQRLGKADSVSKYANLYCANCDSAWSNLNAERVAQVRGMYDYSRMQKEAYHQQMEHKQLLFSATVALALGLLVLAWLLYVIRRNKRMERQQIAQQNERYDQLIEQYRQISEQHELLKQEENEKSQLNMLQSRMIEQLKKQLAAMHPTNALPDDQVLLDPKATRMHRMAKDGCKPTDEDWLQLEQSLSDQDRGFAEWIAAYESRISTRERRLCILTRMRFLPSEQAVLLVTTRSNISNMRARLFRKLTGRSVSASDFDQYIQEI